MERTVSALSAMPEQLANRSDRAIAEELGVSRGTVIRARKQVDHGDPPKSARRVGRDGKDYTLPKVKAPKAVTTGKRDPDTCFLNPHDPDLDELGDAIIQRFQGWLDQITLEYQVTVFEAVKHKHLTEGLKIDPLRDRLMQVRSQLDVLIKDFKRI
jgi:DNA-binding transcriptional MocR family regulator